MENAKTFTAYFSASRISTEKLPDDSVLIYPSSNLWNDFSHRTLFEFLVSSTPTERPRTFRLAFLGLKEQPADVVKAALSNRAEPFVLGTELPQFFSLQFDMDEYRGIVRTFGAEYAEKILLSLNDLVAVRKNLPVPEWVDEAVKSEVFAMSLIRTSDSFFAYFNAKSILSGLSFEDLNTATNHLKFKFQLPGFSNEHSYDFKFSTQGLVPKRIAILIGKNGVGKSRTLNQLVVAALEGSSALSEVDGGRPQISRIIAVSTPGETESTFPPEPTQGATINYRRISASPGEKADTIGQTLPELLLQLARHRGTIGDADRWSIFRSAVSRLLPFETLRLVPATEHVARGINETVLTAIRVVEIDDLRYGGEQRCLEAARMVDRNGSLVRQIGLRYVPLSSGQLSFVRLAAQLCLHVENGSLLLIDEPETHLHPNLVTDLVSMLNKILDLSGSIAIVATHSAYLVREVPGSQVHVIRELENRAVEVIQPRLKTFGAEVGAISNFVFGDEIVNRLIEDIEAQLRASPDGYPNWEEQLKAELSTEALMHLHQRLNERVEGNAQ